MQRLAATEYWFAPKKRMFNNDFVVNEQRNIVSVDHRK